MVSGAELRKLFCGSDVSTSVFRLHDFGETRDDTSPNKANDSSAVDYLRQRLFYRVRSTVGTLGMN